MASSLEGGTPFETYLLSLLSTIDKDPSLAFEAFPVTETKTPAQQAIAHAIISLGQRAAGQATPGLTPMNGTTPFTVCPTCARPTVTSPRTNGAVSDLSAEKELDLLKAQVQDIARVCKVSLS